MTQFLVYSTRDKPGQILRCGSVSGHSSVKSQAREGQAAIEGRADPATQMVVDGKLVDRPGSRLPALMEVVAGRVDFIEVPKGGKVRLPPAGKWQVVEDGKVEVEMASGESMVVEVRPPWPVMEYRLTIHAH